MLYEHMVASRQVGSRPEQHVTYHVYINRSWHPQTKQLSFGTSGLEDAPSEMAMSAFFHAEGQLDQSMTSVWQNSCNSRNSHYVHNCTHACPHIRTYMHTRVHTHTYAHIHARFA